MKKDRVRFSIFCLVIYCLVSLPVSQIALAGYVPNDSCIYSFYTTDNVKNILNASVINNGNSCIVSCDSKNAQNVRNSIDNILGESIQINNPTKLVKDYIHNSIKQNYLFNEFVGETEIIYCYDQTLLRYIMVSEQKVNLQIAFNKDFIVIGYPLILGSF